MTTHELSWSAFLREPTQVEPFLARGDVLLKRRDGDPLRLSRATDGEATRAALSAAARLLAPSDSAAYAKIAEAMSARLPWTRFLPDVDRRTFVDEFMKEFEACADLGDFTSLGRLLSEWKATALLYAEGIADKLKRPIVKLSGRVPRPK